MRNQIALVGQEPVLFSGSVFDNVRLGVEEITSLEDVIEACKLANAATFIEQLPLACFILNNKCFIKIFLFRDIKLKLVKKDLNFLAVKSKELPLLEQLLENQKFCY